MKRKTQSPKATNETELLELLKQVLPKATHDPKLAGKILSAVEKELKLKSRAKAFDKFCTRCELPDLKPASVKEVRRQLAEGFSGADITVKTNNEEKFVAVEVSLPDGAQFAGRVKVKSSQLAEEDEDAMPLKFEPFPVSLPGDAELVWLLAKDEKLAPQEASMALTRAEEEFWGSKTGQQLIRDRVEQSFPEFIARVPAGMLRESGLKRHYKTPEPVKILRPLKKRR